MQPSLSDRRLSEAPIHRRHLAPNRTHFGSESHPNPFFPIFVSVAKASPLPFTTHHCVHTNRVLCFPVFSAASEIHTQFCSNFKLHVAIWLFFNTPLPLQSELVFLLLLLLFKLLCFFFASGVLVLNKFWGVFGLGFRSLRKL